MPVEDAGAGQVRRSRKWSFVQRENVETLEGMRVWRKGRTSIIPGVLEVFGCGGKVMGSILKLVFVVMAEFWGF